MDIGALADAVGETPRQIRYLIAEGFIPGPRGSRTRPNYGDEHIEAIRHYQALRTTYKPAQIKVLLETERIGGDRLTLELLPGVFLQIDPTKVAEDIDPREVADRAVKALETTLNRTPRTEKPDAA